MTAFFPGFDKHRVMSNGVSINLVHGGAGDPVLLIHGYPQTHVLWHKVAPKIAEKYRVVAPDMRGYGDSDKPASDPEDHTVYCMRTRAKDLVGVMEALGHSRWHVVGHDRGARVGHRMALDNPDRILSFVSLDVIASQGHPRRETRPPARPSSPRT